MPNIQFKVFSELYGETDAVICNIDESIRAGYCPCGDGSDYIFTEHELIQLRDGIHDDFIPSSRLKDPLNLVALMRIDGDRLLLPNNFRFNAKQYASVKNVLLTAGGTYNKNTFVFKEDARTVYNRIINGENFNLKKKFQFFGTPDFLADRLVKLANLKSSDKILEPEAGQAAIVKAIHRVIGNDKTIYGYELMPQNKEILKNINNFVLLGDDFLTCTDKFDKIIANPPFSKNQDIDHILKMWECLNDKGQITTIASKHWKHSDGKKEKKFRDWLDKVGHEEHELPAGEFKESGTNISSVILIIKKP